MLKNKLYLCTYSKSGIKNFDFKNIAFHTENEAINFIKEQKEAKVFLIKKVKMETFTDFFNFVANNKKDFCFIVERIENKDNTSIKAEGHEVHLDDLLNPFSKSYWIKDLFSEEQEVSNNIFGSYMIDFVRIKKLIHNNPDPITKKSAYVDCAIYILEKQIKNKKIK